MHYTHSRLFTLMLSLGALAACEGEDQPLGQEDAGVPGDLAGDARDDGPPLGDASNSTSDAGVFESEIRNLVVTLVQRDVFANGEVEDTYRGSFTIQNGSNRRVMREINRLVIETPAGRASFTDWQACGGVYGLELHSEAFEVFRFDLVYQGNSTNIRLLTDCGESVRTSEPPTIPTVMTVEVYGLYEDGEPFGLSTFVTTIDGR